MVNIHPQAIVSKKARLADDVEIGPYSIVNDSAVIGACTKIGAFCVIGNNTSIGKDCKIFTGAVVGSIPQDLKYSGQTSYLEIGDNNIIREYCTLNTGTGEGGKTIIGNGNLLMAYAHIAHDCVVGDDCIIANNGTLAGHVIVEDKVVVGGLVAIHQFSRLGKLSIIGGCSKVVQDIPPFSTCDGHPARTYGLNIIGLRRSNLSTEAVSSLRQAFKLLFNSGLATSHATEKILTEIKPTEEISYLLDFIRNSKRGVC